VKLNELIDASFVSSDLHTYLLNYKGKKE